VKRGLAKRQTLEKATRLGVGEGFLKKLKTSKTQGGPPFSTGGKTRKRNLGG